MTSLLIWAGAEVLLISCYFAWFFYRVSYRRWMDYVFLVIGILKVGITVLSFVIGEPKSNGTIISGYIFAILQYALLYSCHRISRR